MIFIDYIGSSALGIRRTSFGIRISDLGNEHNQIELTETQWIELTDLVIAIDAVQLRKVRK